MNYAEFGKELNRLKEVYGDKSYPDARVKLIFNWAKRLNADAFELIVSKLIGDNSYAPLLDKFKTAYGEIRATLPKMEQECVYCMGSGFILSGKFPELGSAYACCCAHGERVPSFVARWLGPFVRIKPNESELVRHVDTKKLITQTFDKKQE